MGKLTISMAMASIANCNKFPEASPKLGLGVSLGVRAIGSTLDDQVEEANRHDTQNAILGTI